MAADILKFSAWSREEDAAPSVAFHLLGLVGFDTVAELQRRIADEGPSWGSRKITAFLCEHPPIVTVGRRGSRRHIRFSHEELERRSLPVRWVSRSGGCWLHTPGQLTLYVMTPREILANEPMPGSGLFDSAIAATLTECGVATEHNQGLGGLWGRTGAIAVTASSTRRDMVYHDAIINVNPPMHDFAFVDTIEPEIADVGTKTTMGSMLSEIRQPTRMSAIRSALMAHLASKLNCERYHIYTGHPWLRTVSRAAA